MWGYGALPARIWHWFTGFFSPRRVPVAIEVDRTATYLAAIDRDPGPRTRPIEPSIAVDDDRIVAVHGRTGHGVDSEAIVAAMSDAATHGLPLDVTVGRGQVPTRFSLVDAERVAAKPRHSPIVRSM